MSHVPSRVASEVAKPSIILAASLARGTEPILYGRVSEYTQVSNGSLEAQKQWVLKQVRELGLVPRAFVFGRESGTLSEDRPHLQRAFDLARKHNVGIVAASLPRLLRSEPFDKEVNWRAMPTQEEIDALLALADGVPFLATIMPPEASPEEIHHLETKRGMARAKAEGRRPGPKPKITEIDRLSMILDRMDGATYDERQL